MYFDEPKDATPAVGHAEMRGVLSLNGLLVLAIGIIPQPLMGLCFDAIKAL
jgi:NADH-quinone oxidoreductase subunit N